MFGECRLACCSQIIFPRSYFPAFLVQSLDDWVRDADDQLTGRPPIWYKAFVWVELLFHLPYFFAATYAFVRGANWIRDVSIMYATAVLASMVAIMPAAWELSHAPLQTKLTLQSVLAIWCLLPVLLIQRVWNPRVFDYAAEDKSGKKKQ